MTTNPLRWNWLVFALGALCMAAMIPLGESLEPQLGRLGLDTLQAQSDTGGRWAVFVFAFGFPLGVALCVLGALAHSERSAPRLLAWSLLALLIVAAALLIPAIFGRHSSYTYFGRGGIAILVLVVLVFWRWAIYRAGLPARSRTGADWQGAGYLAFAAAAWNLCGFAGMPAYALYPDRVVALGSQAFAAGQIKTVMALFILGWLFTLVGLLGGRRGDAADSRAGGRASP